MATGLSTEELGELVSCLTSQRLSKGVLFASIGLFFYDFCLTIGMEIHHIWAARFSLGLILFLASRYLGLASCIISLLPVTSTTSDVSVFVRVLAILASEVTLAVRTWAIWSRNRWIMTILVACFIAGIVPAAVVVARDIATKSISSASEPSIIQKVCTAADSSVGNMWAVPYLVVIMYELVTTGLALIRILWWRRRIPNAHRGHLLQTLYTDGMFYFFFMLGCGAVNTGLVIKASAPELRSSVTQLQTSLHSMLSSRVVLHLANSGQAVKQLHTSGSTVAPGGAQFTSIFTSTSHELTNITTTNQ